MKKIWLLLASGLVSQCVMAQQVQKSAINTPVTTVLANNKKTTGSGAAAQAPHNTNHNPGLGGPGGDRWYDYVNDIFAPYTHTGVPEVKAIEMWENNKALFGFTGPMPYADTVHYQSCALSFNPFNYNWNDTALYFGIIGITIDDPYTIDSVRITGCYGRNPATPTIVDTLVLTFVSGDGSSTADLAFGLSLPFGPLPAYFGLTGSLPLLTMYYDSVNNRAGSANSVAIHSFPVTTVIPVSTVYKFPLTVADTIGIRHLLEDLTITYPRAGHVFDPVIDYPVAAGNHSAMSVSFKSGETGIPPYALIRNLDEVTYNYGCFAPIIASAPDTISTPAFPPTAKDDWTTGYFKRTGDGNYVGGYTPHWDWTTYTRSPINLQYPMISYHASCAACMLLGLRPPPPVKVAAEAHKSPISFTPNPANNEINISYSLSYPDEVVISLNNMAGQQVAVQRTTKSDKGTITIDTKPLANGMYTCTFSGGNVIKTERIIVAH